MESKEIRVRGVIYESFATSYDDNFYTERVDIEPETKAEPDPTFRSITQCITIEGPVGTGFSEGFKDGDLVEMIIRKVESET